MQKTCLVSALLSLGLATFPCPGQTNEDAGKYVTREEYEKVLKELEAIKAQLAPVVTQPKVGTNDTEALKGRVENLEKQQQAQQNDNEQTFKDYDKQFKGVNALINSIAPGSTHMLLAGYGSASFQSTSKGYGPAQPLDEISDEPRHGTASFMANFNPIFLWELSQKAMFEGELELEVGPDGAEMMLEYANLSYILNDYLTLTAGKFLNPMNYFVERLHPSWVNKLPDKPLAVYDGLLPESLLGAQVRGGFPIGPTKLEYAFFIANSPTLMMPENDLQRGLLDFEDFSMSHVAPGGRVGFFPIPQLEIGYGFLVPGENGVGGVQHSVELNYMQDWAPLMGTIDLRAQWVWSNLDPKTLDDSGAVVDLPAGLTNHRNGGYVQFAYRPTRVNNKFIKNLEAVFRYDMLNQKDTAVGFDDTRYTVGLDYWLSSSTLLKAAYEVDRQNGTGQNGEAFWLQFAMAF